MEVNKSSCTSSSLFLNLLELIYMAEKNGGQIFLFRDIVVIQCFRISLPSGQPENVKVEGHSGKSKYCLLFLS